MRFQYLLCQNDEEEMLHGLLDPKWAGRRRIKERTINEVIQKVTLWRQLHKGVLNQGKLVRYSLADAAVKVGVKKKSLDDYLLLLRQARRYDFPFNKHLGDKIGVVRRFVVTRKRQETRSKDGEQQLTRN